MKNPWRPIWIMAFASLTVWVAALVIVRTVPPALAQSTEQPKPAPPAVDAADDEEPIGAPVKPQEELPPDLRQSADNNVSFPVDI